MAEELEMLAHVAASCSHSPSLSHSSRVASRLSDNQTLALRIRRVEPAINVTWLSPTRTMMRGGGFVAPLLPSPWLRGCLLSVALSDTFRMLLQLTQQIAFLICTKLMWKIFLE